MLHDEPPHPRSLNPQIGHDLEVICLKCLHKDPEQRYTTAEELDKDLQRLLEGRPIQAKPVSHLVRARNWVAGIPVIDVLRGNRTMQQPTRWQTRAQWMMLATLDLVSELELLEPQAVAQWGGLPWHGAAEQFFEAQGFAP